MKILAILLKDVRHQLRSLFALFMMIAAPLLVAGLMYLAFGGLAKGGTASMAATRVVVADLDVPDPRSGASLGGIVVQHLSEGPLNAMLKVTSAPDESAARAAVDRREADVALVIPAGFTAAAMAAEPGRTATVLLYSDPTLTLGPSLVRAVLASIVDGAIGARIAVQVAGGMDGSSSRATAERYIRWAETHDSVEVRAPAAGAADGGEFAAIIAGVMTSMLIFFVFFTGASAAQSIVREHEEGTLARLSTTPTRTSAVLAGKSLAVGLSIAVQIAVLLAASALLFGIRWGRPGSLLLAAAGLLVAATGFGILLMSFVKDSRHVGVILGVGLTLTSMVGGLFTNFIPDSPTALAIASLALPQGWAVRAWKLALSGAKAGEMLAPVAVLVAMGIAFYCVGLLLHRRRFA